MLSVAFGAEEYERLEIAIQDCERGTTSEYNWLSAEVSIRSGAFHGRFSAAFQTGELEAFHDQLDSLYQTLRGKAEFQTLEGQLSFILTGDGLGHIQLDGKARDQPGAGNCLIFSIILDQTQLQSSMCSLSVILAAFQTHT